MASSDYDFEDFGLISIMYHRFEENKYPSTNIQIEVFKEQLRIIENEGMKFIHPKDFEESLIKIKDQIVAIIKNFPKKELKKLKIIS